ncbi:MAG: glycine--tRNA ligase subunit alpha/beta, partial [Actinomycetota bacterium]|nr:glycine--tRNA ligase subunit alpha/beta [Actinomycetota bacterium]
TSGLAAAAKQLTAQGVSVSPQALADAHEFAVRRYERAVLDSGMPHDIVQATLPLADVPAVADAAIADLRSLTADAQFTALSTALQRSRRIVGPDVPAHYDPSQLTEPAERSLHQTLQQVAGSWQGGGGVADFARVAMPLTAPINTFFDEVLVNADDPGVRAARRGLLATINLMSDPIVDWAALEG